MSPLGEQRRLGRNDSRDKRSESRRRLPFVRIQSGTDELVVHRVISWTTANIRLFTAARGRTEGKKKTDGRRRPRVETRRLIAAVTLEV